MCCILPVMHSDALLCIPVHLGGKHPISMSAVSGGKTVDQIKEMHVLDKKKHADACNKNRAIAAHSVTELATKMGCPSDYTTKLSKLGWIFLQLQA
jgi:hypothetical protein